MPTWSAVIKRPEWRGSPRSLPAQTAFVARPHIGVGSERLWLDGENGVRSRLLRTLNLGEKAAETRSSQALTSTTRRLYLTELAVPAGYIFVTSHALTNVANVPPGAPRHQINNLQAQLAVVNEQLNRVDSLK
jgi:hypothetical protein